MLLLLLASVLSCSSDKDTLLTFYQNATKWGERVNWKYTDDVCKFTGVECNEKNRVIELQLEGLDITLDTSKGEMDVLSCLTDLEALYLSYNKIKGGFPAVICKMTKLKYLYLDGTSLSGQIPECICTGNLGLQYLSTVDNNLSGAIPWCMGTMPGLRSIDVAYNGLSGDVNPLIAQNKNMETVSLKCNRKLSCKAIEDAERGNPMLSFACGWTIMCLLAGIKCLK